MQALEKTGKVECRGINASDVKGADLVQEQGFLANNGKHWFSMRRINGVWYNLNSTNK
jgi:ataxin-3